MSVNFPTNSGIIQKAIRFITEKVNSESKKFDGSNFPAFKNNKLKELGNKLKDLKGTFKISIKSLIEPNKFSPVKDYVKETYSEGSQVSTRTFELKETLDCEVAMRKLQDILDKINKKLETKAAELDKMLEQIQEVLDPITEYQSLIQELMNASLSIDTVVTIVTKLIKLVSWIFTMSVKPVIDITDKLYIMYRELKVTTASSLVELNSLVEIKCVSDCKYKSDYSKCPVLKKLHTKSCPLLKSINPLKGIEKGIASAIDSATAPIDNILTMVDTIANKTPINKVITRKYPSITVKQVQDIIKKLAEEDSYAGQSGTISQPDVDEESTVSTV